MPYANNSGIRIHYDTAGMGPPLVLLHGTTASGEMWQDLGYVDALKRDYRLILPDARGHGGSDKPHDVSAYDLALRVTDVTAVLDDLKISQAHYFGYSLGGWIGFGCAKYAPERFISLILGGTHPNAENMQPFRDRMPNDPAAFLAAMEPVYGPYMNPGLRDRLMKTDLRALVVLTQDRESLADVLPNMAMPCLLFAGEDDPRFPQVQECVKHIGDATFFSLPGCNHVEAAGRSDLVLPHVKSFLARVSPSPVPTAQASSVRSTLHDGSHP